jgi:hypothetical protein
MSSYTIIDADTHVTDTPELWTSRAPATIPDRVPRIETGTDGTQQWVLRGNKGMALGSDNKAIRANPSMAATAEVGSFKNLRLFADSVHQCDRALCFGIPENCLDVLVLPTRIKHISASSTVG